MSAYIAKEEALHKPVLDGLSGERAAALITSSVSADVNVVGFDELEASRLKVKLRDWVSVAPSDTGMWQYSSYVWSPHACGSKQARCLQWGN